MNQEDYFCILRNTQLDDMNRHIGWGPGCGIAKLLEKIPNLAIEHYTTIKDYLGTTVRTSDSLLKLWKLRAELFSTNEQTTILANLEEIANLLWGEADEPDDRRPFVEFSPDELIDLDSVLSEFFAKNRLKQTGFWLAIEAWLESVDVEKFAWLRKSNRAVSMPILLYSDQQGANANPNENPGRVAALEMDRLKHGSALYPHAFAVGLCYIGREEDGFLAATHRAATKSGITPGNRFRWRINQSNFKSEPKSTLHVPMLKGRSCEAAFLCALWAANGGIFASNAEEDKLADGEGLDPYACVTATLEAGEGKDTQLGIISGLPEKALAAYYHGMTLIVVAEGQLEQCQQAVAKIFRSKDINDWRDKLSIKEVRTAGEAFHELIRSERFTKIYQKAVIDDFQSQFCEIEN
jgi:hypothetical protein